MHLSPADLLSTHELLGCVDELMIRRRAIYSVATELAGSDPDRPQPAEVLDNPVVRAHLAEVIAGQSSLNLQRLYPISDLLTAGSLIRFDGHTVRVASTASATSDLAAAIDRIGAELSRHGQETAEYCALLTPIDPTFEEARRRLVDGVTMALELVPEVAADLLPHVAVFALLADAGSGRLGSASAREFPGLVLIPEPREPFEVTEAVIHEGAHQKFFDLAMTSSLFAPDHRAAPAFVSSWAAADAAGWPMEQCFAAFHAYCHLAVLADAVLTRPDVKIHAYSLLQYASERAMELADWLHDQRQFLGPDGFVLLGRLSGRVPQGAAVASDVAALPGASDEHESVAVRDCGSWALVARSGPPMDFCWIPGDQLSEALMAMNGS